MNTKMFSSYLLTLVIMLVLLLGACQPPPAPEPIIETLVVKETIQADPVEVIKVVTPTPEPTGPRTLTICSDWAPDTLFLYGTNTAAAFRIWSIIYDGPIDENNFGYQPVILEKLPNLADGDATLTPVVVSDGDKAVDTNGSVVTLDATADPPIMLVPAGGGNVVAYQGGEFEMDQLSATFNLLPNLTWSDGTPLTAADSIYNFNLLQDPDLVAGQDGTIARLYTSNYEAIDERTVVWTGLPGNMDATYYLNFFTPLPEHIWGKYKPSELYTAEEVALTPIGWGPYRIGEHSPGEQITLQKNPHYFRANEGLPEFDTLTIKYITDLPGALIAALLSGECDLVDSVGEGHLELVLELQKAGLIKAAISNSSTYEQISFGIQPESYDDGYQLGSDRPDFFSDVRTRQAIALCLDRQAAADFFTFGNSPVLDTYLPHFHPLFNNEVPKYEYDLMAGSALLEEVGWVDHDGDPTTPRVAQGVANVADGTLLEFRYKTTESRQEVATILVESLAECGIHAKVLVYPQSLFFQRGPVGGNWWRDFDMNQFAWGNPPCSLYLAGSIPGPVGEPWISIMDGNERIFSEGSSFNMTGFTNQEFDNACNSSLSRLPGQPDYIETQYEVQRIFSEQLPSIPLFSRVLVAATRPDMCNFSLDPTGENLRNIEEFDYGEGCVE